MHNETGMLTAVRQNPRDAQLSLMSEQRARETGVLDTVIRRTATSGDDVDRGSDL